MKNLTVWPAWPAWRAAFTLAVAVIVVLAAGGGLSGCTSLLPKPVAAPTLYALDATPAPASTSSSVALARSSAIATLVVNTPRAAAGFDSQHIMYVREPYKLEYFAHSEWVDTPARMLTPMLVATVAKSGAFKAVVPASIAATGELTLDTEIVRLQQDFSVQPSRVVFSVRAYLLDAQTRKTIAWRELETVVVATEDNPLGGVVAANRAVQMALQQVTDFCVKGVEQWQSTRSAAMSLTQ